MSKKQKPPIPAQTVSVTTQGGSSVSIPVKKGSNSRQVGRAIEFHMSRLGDTPKDIVFPQGDRPDSSYSEHSIRYPKKD